MAIPKCRADYSRVTHPFAARAPSEEGLSARLACVKHAASVRPEPGSNSPKKIQTLTTKQKPTIKRQSQNHCKTTNPTPKHRERSTGKQTNQFIDYHTLLSSQRSGAHQRRRPVRAAAMGALPTLASRTYTTKSWRCLPAVPRTRPSGPTVGRPKLTDIHPKWRREWESPGAESPLTACSPPRPAQRT